MLRSVAREQRHEMRSTVTVTRGGEAAVDDAGDLVVASSVVYSGRATVTRPGVDTRQTTWGEAGVTTADVRVELPRTAAAATGDVVTVDASPDPDLAGLHLRVADVVAGDHSTVRLLVCEAIRG